MQTSIVKKGRTASAGDVNLVAALNRRQPRPGFQKGRPGPHTAWAINNAPTLYLSAASDKRSCINTSHCDGFGPHVVGHITSHTGPCLSRQWSLLNARPPQKMCPTSCKNGWPVSWWQFGLLLSTQEKLTIMKNGSLTDGSVWALNRSGGSFT